MQKVCHMKSEFATLKNPFLNERRNNANATIPLQQNHALINMMPNAQTRTEQFLYPLIAYAS